MENNKLQVTYFQRKPRPGFSFSLEYIFSDIRNRLSDRIDPMVVISPMFNDGYYTKIINVLSAWRNEGPSVNHITGETHFLNLLMRKSSVLLTVLDCGMVSRKSGLEQQIVKWIYLRAPVRKARYVTAISEVTKQEIIQYTGCSPDIVVVIPVAVDPLYQPVPKKFNQDLPTLLHIGTGYNKNLLRLIEALEGLPCRLVIIGKLTEEQREKLNVGTVQWENYHSLSQREMYEQYIACDLLSFVSTFEGFGMPIVEANVVERPVVTSNLSSMPEVAGDAACLVDPYDVQDIRRGIERVIQNENYREQLIRNGRRNKARFDPDIIAQAYYELYCKMQD